MRTRSLIKYIIGFIELLKLVRQIFTSIVPRKKHKCKKLCFDSLKKFEIYKTLSIDSSLIKYKYILKIR